MSRRHSSQPGRKCVVCSHPERLRIEMARLAGASLDSIAAKFECSRDAVWRHCTKHVNDDRRAMLIADTPMRELADRAAEEGLSLIDYLGIVRSAVMGQLLEAAAVKDRHATAVLAGRSVEVLRELGRFTGEILKTAPVGNVTTNVMLFMSSPAFTSLERMLIERLTPHPEALKAVLEGLRSLEGGSDEPPTMPPTLTLPATEVQHARAA